LNVVMILHSFKNIYQKMSFKLFLLFLLIIVCFTSINAIFIYLTRLTYEKMFNLQQQTIDIQRISSQNDNLFNQMTQIVYNKDISQYDALTASIDEQERYINTLYSISPEPIRFRYKSLYNMTSTFNDQCDSLIALIKNNAQSIYISHDLTMLDNLRLYIREEYNLVLNYHLAEIQSYYQYAKLNVQKMETIPSWILLGAVLFFITISLLFSRRMVSPISELVQHVQKVSKDNFTQFKPMKKNYYEINVLVGNYNKLIEEIRLLLGQAEQSAENEREMKDQAIKTLGLANELKQSELNFLQSQINPHFLFNTLNAIASMAQMEGADKSQSAIIDLAKITRYNLKNISHFVTLEDEMAIIQSYLSIQNIRFGERFKYTLFIDDSVRKYKIPSMIIQPFVENAIIHGLEPKKGNGNLWLLIFDHADNVSIVIKDDGMGIPAKTLHDINQFLADDTEALTGNIGIKNVLKRLYMLLGENVVSIKTKLNAGTEVRISLKKDFMTVQR
jgi:two-component system, sensor histidine kinase YesM